MRPPKHIRDKRKQELEAIVNTNTNNMPALRASSRPVISETAGRKFSLGYRPSPSPTISHRFSMHPGKSLDTSSPWGILTAKQKAAKFRLSDAELYDGKLAPKSVDNRVMKRVGTIPAHKILVTDKETGEKHLIKIPEQPRWREVGTP